MTNIQRLLRQSGGSRAIFSGISNVPSTLILKFERRPLQHRTRQRTNTISDQTANIAIYNVDEPAKRKKHCERLEAAVRKLPRLERLLLADEA
ncbi:hypothetical protein [Paenibacillus sp. LjRoot56]|uniref:hypothetical protein n=1 Tax=Paenibacillus sp. LjRoot56 TaxID=3342333 RepID=UPI003F4FA3DF